MFQLQTFQQNESQPPKFFENLGGEYTSKKKGVMYSLLDDIYNLIRSTTWLFYSKIQFIINLKHVINFKLYIYNIPYILNILGINC